MGAVSQVPTIRLLEWGAAGDMGPGQAARPGPAQAYHPYYVLSKKVGGSSQLEKKWLQGLHLLSTGSLEPRSLGA